MALTIQIGHNNLILKIVSLIFGFMFWYIISQAFHTSLWITIPVVIDNTPEHFLLEGPETVAIQLSGKRSDLRLLNLETIALHIDAHNIHDGTNNIIISHEKLFLPASINLIHYKPLICTIHATRTISKDTTPCTA